MPLTRRSSASTRKADDESQNDSGYGSQDSLQIAKFSQVATPNTVDTSSERGTELRLSSTTTLLSFNSGIDEVFTKRFYAIQPSVESLLLQYTQRKSFLRNPGRHKPMVIRLMLLGAAKNVAEPHIVVFCAREMRKRVQHFFDTDELIKTFYKPADAFLPSFEVAVCGCAPQLRNGETYIEVFCDTTAEADITDGLEYKTSFTGTLCGTPIRMQTGERVANATLGGLVKIEFMNGETKLYGLTASHPIRALLDSKDKSVENDENASLSTTSTSSGSDWSEGGSEEAPDDFCSSHLAPQKNTDDGGHSDAWQFEYPIKIGDVLSPYSKTAVDVPATHGSLDWALIEINAPQPNRLPVFLFRHDNNLDKWKLGIAEYLQESPSATQSLSEERVLLMCGSSGAKTGNLAPQPARILISPQYSFVDAYLVVLDDGDGMLCTVHHCKLF
jgi:hypothetical protein